MTSVRPDSAPAGNDSAYLVFRDGELEGEVFRLVPGQVTTIGRAPTNRIVLRDEICSRNHCEIFQSGHSWRLRDLASRNGTRVNGTAVAGDWELESGQVIQIGSTELGFTDDLSRPFPAAPRSDKLDGDTATEMDQVAPGPEPAILQRRRKSRYQSQAPVVGRDRTSEELARLYRLGLEMGAAGDSRKLSEVVLEGLFSATSADIGAILLLPRATTSIASPDDLTVVAYKSQGEVPYQRVSDYLSGAVLADREAVLAHDVTTDAQLSTRDSLGEIHVQSVICAPVRVDDSMHGLVHLYSTNPENPVDEEDLEFTLAVAEQFALALESLKQREQLAEGLARAQTENQTLRQQLALETDLVGSSPVIQTLKDRLARIAPTDATVLIRGESGVGKELVARAIHFNSERRNGPFVCMNCAALTESLLESELFGHEKGSFTGATGRKIGKFEQAHKGTLFLDEVGEMSQAIQSKFLRVLEGHPFERVGGSTAIRVDVRVVAATNRELERSVEAGQFRKDLYFRLNVVEIAVAPLRQRPTDIPLLAEFFLHRFAQKTGRPVTGFAPESLRILGSYDWPGNVRELQNTIERAVILSTGDLVVPDDIQLSTLGSRGSGPLESGDAGPEFRIMSLDELEQQHILATLESTAWNKSQAAQILGIERSTLDRKLKRYQVSRPDE